MSIFIDRMATRGDAWKLHGWPDSLFHIRDCSSRLDYLLKRYQKETDIKPEAYIDAALDLINYAVFFIRNVREGRNG